ncbi:transglycosylase SLT domain-containing protein [Fundidesulfovibrio agrisoli]|uniref:transglycosylase SLT domain-containing protein n=1 Tax=Fundidesulfovibrio agrisoli TaxID=2922717 RepID=UPI001FAB433A|nr:transglycosylase SLT domain-containing protein [Fundidesulfovibrio agrisoli]
MLWTLDSLFGPLARASYRSAGAGEELYVDHLAESYLRAHPDPDEFNGGVILVSNHEDTGPGGLNLDGNHDSWPQDGMRLLASSGEAPERGSTSDSGQPQPSQPAENSASGDAGPAKGIVPLPPHLQWVNDPGMLSTHLEGFMKRNPLNPSSAPKEVRDIYGNMQAPGSNYGPPTGTAQEDVKYWSNYFGYPDQYGYNKVSVESKGKPDAYAKSTHAAGLEQVTPQTAEEVGFNFFNNQGTEDSKDPKRGTLDADAWKTAMADPNFSSMVGSMVARRYFNLAGGDPFRAEAGYRYGFGALQKAKRAGNPWPHPGYIREMFPGQWQGR